MLHLRTASDFPGLLDESTHNSWLSAAEQSFLSGLKLAKRRREWLLGRATVKGVVQHLLSAEKLAKNEIQILPDEDQAPTISLLKGDHLPKLSVSLSHRGEFAVAAVEIALPGRTFGVDLDRVEPRAGSFLRAYFTEGEQAAMACPEALEQDRRVTAFWCVKEAILKALKKGLSVSADRVEVLSMGPGDQVSARYDTELGQGELLVRCWHLPSYVLTWAVIGPSKDSGQVPDPPFPCTLWSPSTPVENSNVVLKLVAS